ncbi:MAG: electron transfer flavoprotein subunit alpha/FixB family protein [Thermodesulfobacteriota bacterium]
MNLLLIAETINNQLSPTYIDLLAVAQWFQSVSPGKITMLIPGKDVRNIAETVSGNHGIDSIVLEHEQLALPNPLLVAEAVKSLSKKMELDVICLPHTMRACQIAAAVANSTDGTCISAVERIVLGNGQMIYRRSLFNGKLLIDLITRKTPTIFTALSGSFQFHPPEDSVAKGVVTSLEKPGYPNHFIPLDLVSSTDRDNAIEEADAIVSAGRGIGKIENMALIRDLAELFNNSGVAGSRTVCDLGWLPYSRQIGETGKRVSPKLYLACGISGARQHTIGFQQAQTVVAINTDPRAVIFSAADFGIVEDLTTFIPLLITKYLQATGATPKNPL